MNAFYLQFIIKVILIESIRLYCLNTRRYGTCTWKVDTQFFPHSTPCAITISVNTNRGRRINVIYVFSGHLVSPSPSHAGCREFSSNSVKVLGTRFPVPFALFYRLQRSTCLPMLLKDVTFLNRKETAG